MSIPPEQTGIAIAMTGIGRAHPDCGCSCHQSGFMEMIYRLLFRMFSYCRMNDKRFCECGEAHW